MRTAALALAVLLAGCFAPPFPDAPESGAGHGHVASVDELPADGASGGGHAGHGPIAAMAGLVVENACFDVVVPGDGDASLVKGFLYHPTAWTARTRVVVLLPGAASLAHIFDGEQIGYGRDNGTTLPRALAREGYAVLVLDRLGLGQSPYAGSGARLTWEAHVAVTHQIVAALREGAYARGVDPLADCPGDAPAEFGSAGVVLGGHSNGGWLTMSYVSTYDDVDGAFTLAAHRQGINTEAFAKITACIASQAPEDYPIYFCPGPQGYSPTCMDHFFHPATSDRDVAEAFCDNRELHREPIGLYAELVNIPTRAAIIAQVARIPFHLTFMENDLMMNGGEDGGDQSRARQEAAEWRALCPCDVTDSTIPAIGHVFQYHRNYHLVNEDVLAWLAASGLEPEVAK